MAQTKERTYGLKMSKDLKNALVTLISRDIINNVYTGIYDKAGIKLVKLRDKIQKSLTIKNAPRLTQDNIAYLKEMDYLDRYKPYKDE